MIAFLNPEPPVEPLEYCECLDCGCECYEGNAYIEFDGKTWCKECLCDYLKTLDYDELERILDCDVLEMGR